MQSDQLASTKSGLFLSVLIFLVTGVACSSNQSPAPVATDDPQADHVENEGVGHLRILPRPSGEAFTGPLNIKEVAIGLLGFEHASGLGTQFVALDAAAVVLKFENSEVRTDVIFAEIPSGEFRNVRFRFAENASLRDASGRVITAAVINPEGEMPRIENLLVQHGTTTWVAFDFLPGQVIDVDGSTQSLTVHVAFVPGTMVQTSQEQTSRIDESLHNRAASVLLSADLVAAGIFDDLAYQFVNYGPNVGDVISTIAQFEVLEILGAKAEERYSASQVLTILTPGGFDGKYHVSIGDSPVLNKGEQVIVPLRQRTDGYFTILEGADGKIAAD